MIDVPTTARLWQNDGVVALRAKIEEMKAGDPLAAITVIVPSHRCGRRLRRQTDDLPNVRFATLDRVAEVLAAPLLSRERTPLTRLFRFQATRIALREAPEAWRHPATAKRIADTFSHLRRAAPEERGRLLASKPELAGLLARYERAIAGFYDAADALRVAAERSVGGRYLIYRPGSLGEAERRLVASLRAEPFFVEPSAPETTCWVVPDAEQEIRTAISEILALAAQGEPIDRMAVLYGSREPYAAICREQLSAAGVPFEASSFRTLAQTVPGRAVSGLLRYRRHGYRRRDLIEWLTSAPIVHDGEEIDGHGWDRPERREGIPGESSEQSFLARVEGDISSLPAEAPWTRFRDWTLGVLDRYLAPEQASREETEAVRNAISSLGGLEAFGEPATVSEFEDALTFALNAPSPSCACDKPGLFAGTLDEAIGMSFDTVFLLGMTGDSMSAGAEGSLLVSDDFPLEARSLYDSVRGSCRRLHLFYPRADVRSRRESSPARLFLEEVGRIVGRAPVHADELAILPRADRFWYIASFSHALTCRPPATIQELDLRLLRSNPAHPLDTTKRTALDRAAICLSSRAGGLLTEWDGSAGAPAPTTLSASALEEYATCPFRFFLRRVLRVVSPEEPEPVYGLDAVENGALVHSVLHDFFATAPDLPPDEPWPPEQRARLAEIANKALDQCAKADTPLWRAEREGILEDLEALLSVDDDFRRSNGCRPMRFEVEFGWKERLAIESTDAEAAFQGFIDRVDVAEGRPPRLIVIDYKTGRGTKYSRIPKSDPLDRGRNVQLPIYALAAESMWLAEAPSVEASYWFVSRAVSPTFRTVSLTDDVRLRLRQCLGIALDAIRRGMFPMTPGAPGRRGYQNCSSCDFRSVCPADPGQVWERKSSDPSLADLVALFEGDHE